MIRIQGLDSIRFICAVMVLIGHLYLPLTAPPHSILWFFEKSVGLFFDGPAAVAVFFVISGFCIHYPFANSPRINLKLYYLRRLLRIGIPLIVGLVLSQILLKDRGNSLQAVIWSLYCEMIYYIIYPLLREVARKIGWVRMIYFCFIVSTVFFFILPKSLVVWGNGIFFTSIKFLPLWLLGCLLVEKYDKSVFEKLPIWVIRILFLTISPILLFLNYHTPVTFSITLLGLGVFIFYWLQKEIQRYLIIEPWALLEWGGKWSYSLYLMHKPVIQLISNLGWKLSWFSEICVILVICYIFSCLVESPTLKFISTFKNINFT